MLSRLERRASPENPSTNLSNPASWLYDAFGATTSKAGVTVNENTALNLSAVWAAVRVLTDMVAALPFPVYERLERGKRKATEHPQFELLHDRPNREMSAFTFREALQGHLALRGNAYAEKERNGRGEVVAYWPISPDRVTPRWARGSDGVRKVFEVEVDGQRIVLGPDQVLHIPGFGYDGLVGYSPVRMAMESLSLGKAAEQFGSSLFGQGLKPSGVLMHPKGLSDKAQKNLRDSIEHYSSGLSNAQRLLILEEDMKYTQTTIPPNEAQFLETRKFQTAEIARWFKVPPHMIGDLERSTNNNIEHQSIEFVTHTAAPWLRRWEQVFNWEAFSKNDRGRYFAEFQMAGLLRGDHQARGEYYSKQFSIGAMSQNDIRELENMNPIDGGDRYYVQGALVPVDKIDEVIKAQTAPRPAPAPAPSKPARSLRPVLLEAAERVVKREAEELRKAVKAGSVEEWADGFGFDEAKAFAAKRFLPSVLAMGGDAARAGELAHEWASSTVAVIRRTIREGGDVAGLVEKWERERAEAWVDGILGGEA